MAGEDLSFAVACFGEMSRSPKSSSRCSSKVSFFVVFRSEFVLSFASKALVGEFLVETFSAAWGGDGGGTPIFDSVSVFGFCFGALVASFVEAVAVVAVFVDAAAVDAGFVAAVGGFCLGSSSRSNSSMTASGGLVTGAAVMSSGQADSSSARRLEVELPFAVGANFFFSSSGRLGGLFCSLMASPRGLSSVEGFVLSVMRFLEKSEASNLSSAKKSTNDCFRKLAVGTLEGPSRTSRFTFT